MMRPVLASILVAVYWTSLAGAQSEACDDPVVAVMSQSRALPWQLTVKSCSHSCVAGQHPK